MWSNWVLPLRLQINRFRDNGFTSLYRGDPGPASRVGKDQGGERPKASLNYHRVKKPNTALKFNAGEWVIIRTYAGEEFEGYVAPQHRHDYVTVEIGEHHHHGIFTGDILSVTRPGELPAHIKRLYMRP